MDRAGQIDGGDAVMMPGMGAAQTAKKLSTPLVQAAPSQLESLWLTHLQQSCCAGHSSRGAWNPTAVMRVLG